MVFIRRPKLEKIRGNYIISPFTVGLWWTVIITIISLMITFVIDWRIRHNYGLRKSEDLARSIFFIFSIFCQQGEYRSPNIKARPLLVSTLHSGDTPVWRELSAGVSNEFSERSKKATKNRKSSKFTININFKNNKIIIILAMELLSTTFEMIKFLIKKLMVYLENFRVFNSVCRELKKFEKLCCIEPR